MAKHKVIGYAVFITGLYLAAMTPLGFLKSIEQYGGVGYNSFFDNAVLLVPAIILLIAGYKLCFRKQEGD